MKLTSVGLVLLAAASSIEAFNYGPKVGKMGLGKSGKRHGSKILGGLLSE